MVVAGGKTCGGAATAAAASAELMSPCRTMAASTCACRARAACGCWTGLKALGDRGMPASKAAWPSVSFAALVWKYVSAAACAP